MRFCGATRPTAVVTWWALPESMRSMRAASASSCGFSSTCSSTTTIVSAPSTKSCGNCSAILNAFSCASLSAYSAGNSCGWRASRIWAGWTSKSIPASRRSSWRRGEAEARISLGLASILKNCASVSRYVKPQTLSKTTSGMLGASLTQEGCEFRLWAPHAQQVKLHLTGALGEREFAMERADEGHFELLAPARAGDRYSLIVDGNQPVPDPVSRWLPEGVHGRTEIVDPAPFGWTDSHWRGLPLEDYIIY